MHYLGGGVSGDLAAEVSPTRERLLIFGGDPRSIED